MDFRQLLFKDNPYRAADGRWTTKEKAKTITTMDRDMEKQHAWLTDRAKELGHPDVDALAATDMTKFFDLAKKWRRHHTFKIEDILNLRVG